MNPPPTVLRGIVHGNTIEFESNLGLVDGQEVSVTVLPVQGYAPAGLPSFLIEAQQRLRKAREQAQQLPPRRRFATGRRLLRGGRGGN